MNGRIICLLALLLAGCEDGKQANPDQSEAAIARDVAQKMEPVAGGGAVMTFTIPPGVLPSLIEASAREACAGKPFCQVYGWEGESDRARAWPMLDRELDALAFRYAINRDSGYESVEWSCGSIGAKPGCSKAN